MNDNFFDPDPAKPSKNRPPGRTKQKTDEELKRDAELSTLFEDCEQAYTIKVYRNDPDWCSGYLGYFKKGARKGLTMDEIKNRFGGREFQLIVFYTGMPGIRKQRTVIIEDAPRREGMVLNRDGTTQPPPGSDFYGKNTPLEQVAAMNLPAHLQKQMASYFMGIPEEPQGPQQQSYAPGPIHDMFMQKTMMDMMNQQSQSQMQMMREQYEMHQRMMRDRRDAEHEDKKNPMGDMENIIRMIRELNGIKTELGGSSDQPLASQILDSVMPFAETMMTEYWGAKKLQLQNQLALRSAAIPAPPELPKRAPSVSATSDPVSKAREMGRLYRSLGPDAQRDVMRTFLGVVDDDIDDAGNDDIDIDETWGDGVSVAAAGASDILMSEDDRRILSAGDNPDDETTPPMIAQDHTEEKNGDGHDIIETDYVPDVVNTGTAETDDPSDRAGDSGRVNVPADPAPGGTGDVDVLAEKLY